MSINNEKIAIYTYFATLIPQFCIMAMGIHLFSKYECIIVIPLLSSINMAMISNRTYDMRLLMIINIIFIFYFIRCVYGMF